MGFDYKMSMIDLDEDLIRLKTAYDYVRPSLNYRFYLQGSIVWIARCSDDKFRVLLNFYPNRQFYTYNSKPVPIFRYRKWTCVCESEDLFDCKRCFIIYVRHMVDDLRDAMFSFQPLLGDI